MSFVIFAPSVTNVGVPRCAHAGGHDTQTGVGSRMLKDVSQTQAQSSHLSFTNMHPLTRNGMQPGTQLGERMREEGLEENETPGTFTTKVQTAEHAATCTLVLVLSVHCTGGYTGLRFSP